MRFSRSSTVLVSTLAILAAATTATAAERGSGTLLNTDGKQVGTVTLTQVPTGVLIEAEVSGLPAGEHGFHIHETGQCDAAGGFKSAGGHFALSKKHGFTVEGGPHPGDMPNIHVPDSGALTIEVMNTRISLADGDDNTLFDQDGSALMIHSGADDYESQPSGDAGERIACAVLKPGNAQSAAN